MRSRPTVVLLVGALLLARQVAAQQAAADSTPSARAMRAEQAPVIDGREDDAVWRSIPATADFLEFQPAEGKAPRFRTEFKAAYDDRNLYVFVRAYDPHPDSIMTALTRRDERGPSDQLKLMIDSYHDRRSGFEFAVNPVGVKRDYAMYNDQQEDQSWDGIWDAGTRIDSLGWTAEFRIPFSQLRYANKSEHVFGFSVWRDIERFKERTSWPLFRGSKGGVSSQLGLLTGITGITPFHRLEVTPYALARSTNVHVTAAPPGEAPWAQSQKASAGVDVKYGITPNLTLDATVNPDFGQVEADPSVVNLSAFETFFQEKRPFFIEGTGLYSFALNCSIVNCGGEGLFYSRRIGRSPQLFGRYADDASPNVTPILGAAKVTGRLGGGLNLGVLEAVTDRVQGTGDRTTEPRTSYSVLRAQQDLRHGETSIGLIATGVNRALDEWTSPFLRSDAYAAGANARHRWDGGRYELSASLTGSSMHGSPEAMLRTQANPVHLYQRPDAGLPLDSSRTVLNGDAEEVIFGKTGGRWFRFQTRWQRQSPGFDVNDLGYLRRANLQSFNNWAAFTFRDPNHVFRQLQGNFNAWGYWTSAGLPTERALNTNWHMNLQNNTWVNAGVTLGQLGGVYCDNCARGGPAFRTSPITNVNLSWQGDDRGNVVPSIFTSLTRGDGGRSRTIDVSPEIQFLPLPQLQLDLSAEWNRNHDDGQWLGNFTDAEGVTHYTFARLEQETQSVGVRVSYAMTTTLSFQLYAAPFVSRGKYSSPRELSATPRAEAYDDRYASYTPPPGTSMGFDVLQLRSNSVLRWEFRPGSTLFAVWSHGRDGFDGQYLDRPWREEYDGLFALHPINTVLVKVAYLLD
ncbi:MAG TPA: DUF5916 domain-containing protein [Gemmatimonadaceae bacterium]|nr:DUF5916 domain-containing protein [Gemmatimonadaceae bacterium]